MTNFENIYEHNAEALREAIEGFKALEASDPEEFRNAAVLIHRLENLSAKDVPMLMEEFQARKKDLKKAVLYSIGTMVIFMAVTIFVDFQNGAFGAHMGWIGALSLLGAMCVMSAIYMSRLNVISKTFTDKFMHLIHTSLADAEKYFPEGYVVVEVEGQ